MAVPLMLAFFLIASGWQQGAPVEQKRLESVTPYVEKSEKEFAFYPGGKLEIIAATSGNFRIIGWKKAVVRVEMEKVFFYLSPDQAQAMAKRYPTRITYTQTLAKISTTGSQLPDAAMEVNAVVYVPGERTDLNIKMIKGDLFVEAMNGSVEATLEEGSIEAKNLSGYISALTKLGDLNVELSGTHWTGYGITAATRKGSVALRLPTDYSATLQLETRDGKISFDYPERVVEGESIPLQVLARKKTRSINAPIGAGGVPIRLTTFSGDIVFTGKNRQN
jgi:DUF4097 and DUF4098 domain-containing protein YvlB